MVMDMTGSPKQVDHDATAAGLGRDLPTSARRRAQGVGTIALTPGDQR
jgi:hypothetical protein